MVSDRQSQLVRQAARRFGADAAQFVPLAGGHAALVFEWMQHGQPLVLKIMPAEDDADVQHARSILGWLAHLAAHHVSAVKPILSPQGCYLETLEFNGKSYLISASQKISGVRAEMLSYQAWSAPLIRTLGRVLGECHAAARTYIPSNLAPPPPIWEAAGNCFNPTSALHAANGMVIEKRAQTLKLIETLPKDSENWGLIHGDLHFANFMVEPATSTICLFDFDDCAYG